jgi:hypothetical protein
MLIQRGIVWPMRECVAEPECTRRVESAAGWCNMHYKRWLRTGDPLGRRRIPGLTPSERFWSKVHKTETCWLWTAGRIGAGYGTIRVGDRAMLAHRFAYEELVGTIPDGLELDHLCRVRHCVNPAHLEAVTGRVNSQRGHHPQGWRTHCPQGHPYAGNNLYVHNGKRYCRTCMRARDRAYKERRRQK